jgi:hypothetical protein
MSTILRPSNSADRKGTEGTLKRNKSGGNWLHISVVYSMKAPAGWRSGGDYDLLDARDIESQFKVRRDMARSGSESNERLMSLLSFTAFPSYDSHIYCSEDEIVCQKIERGNLTDQNPVPQRSEIIAMKDRLNHSKGRRLNQFAVSKPFASF